MIATQELVTTQGLIIGTVAYMSPEQVSGEQLDGRTDIFALGVVLYECATGRQPFTGKTSGVTIAAILNQSPVAPTLLNPEVPMRLQEVINNCLEKDPELRYPDAAGLRADLRRIRRDLESGHSRVLGVAAATEQPLAVDARLTPQPRTRRWLFGALTMAVVAAVNHVCVDLGPETGIPTLAASHDNRRRARAGCRHTGSASRDRPVR